MTQWIPTDDRLPEEKGVYIVFSRQKGIQLSLFDPSDSRWQVEHSEYGKTAEVLFWMPLPERPSEFRLHKYRYTYKDPEQNTLEGDLIIEAVDEYDARYQVRTRDKNAYWFIEVERLD